MKFNIDRQKIIEIIITAVISVLIAVLQNLLLGIGAQYNTGEVTVTAGLYGGIIRACRA